MLASPLDHLRTQAHRSKLELALAAFRLVPDIARMQLASADPETRRLGLRVALKSALNVATGRAETWDRITHDMPADERQALRTALADARELLAVGPALYLDIDRAAPVLARLARWVEAIAQPGNDSPVGWAYSYTRLLMVRWVLGRAQEMADTPDRAAALSERSAAA